MLMFEKIGFSLDHSEDTKLQVVQKFRSLIQSHFKNILDIILSKSNYLVVRIADELVDIS
jgi:hypothetical protein